MTQQKNEPQYDGWEFEIALDPKVKPIGSMTNPATAYHRFQAVKVGFVGGTEKASAAIDITLRVIESQKVGPDGAVDDSKDLEVVERLWLGFATPEATLARMKAQGGNWRNDEAMAKSLRQEEGRFKAYLLSVGYSKEQVADLAKLKINPTTFMGAKNDKGEGTLTCIAFFERRWYDEAEDKGYGPYWNFEPKDEKAEAKLAGNSFRKLINADRMSGARGSVAVGGASVGGSGLGTPGGGLGAPGGGLGAPGAAPGLGAPTQAAAPVNGLGAPSLGGGGQASAALSLGPN